MKKSNAVKAFQNSYASLYFGHADYWSAQFMWAVWIDQMIRDGQLQESAADWETPFPYGKDLKPTPRMVNELGAYYCV